MKIITICGSRKFKEVMAKAAETLTLAGNCVMTPIELTRISDEEYSEEEIRILGLMHKEKIRRSDAILVVNVGGYIGDSTKSEIEFAEGLGKEIIYYTDLDIPENQLIKKWLDAFGCGVNQKNIVDHVLSYGNLLWHLFSYKYTTCLEGKAARTEFDKLDYSEALLFCDGYSGNISDITDVGKITALDVDNVPCGDVYVVAKDFSWTYVRTHEKYCGPYFCKIK